MYSYIILALVSVAAANTVPEAKCPEVSCVKDFNFDSYFTGTWYELARYPNKAEKGGQCGYADYKLENGVVKVKNYHVLNNKLRSIEGTAKLADDAGTTGKTLFSFPYGPSGTISNNVLNVLATDYNNYAIVYYCKYIEAKKSVQELTWVLSRTKKLEGDVKVTVDNFLKESKYIDSSKLVWPDFSDEACRVDA